MTAQRAWLSAGSTSVQPAWLTSGRVELEFLESVVELYRSDDTRRLLAAPISYRSGPHLSIARTAIGGMFLDGDAEWLLMLDTDMVFTPEDLLRMLGAADADTAPVVGGCYVGTHPNVGRSAEWRPTREAQVGELLPVSVVGTGFLLVHRGVLERLLALHGPPLPWFRYDVPDVHFGEDWEFCRRVRDDLALPVYVHTGVRLGHVKRLTVGCDPSEDVLSVGAQRRTGAGLAPPSTRGHQ